jgi:serine/threonine protein kinase
LELQTLCMGCMEDKGSNTKCPSCSFSEAAAPDSPYYLQLRTILQDKYLIGRALGQGGFAITYLAWDMNLGIKLAIKEYFPLDLVYRIPGNNLVIAHSKGQDTIFVHDMDKFLSEARTLARFMDHPSIVSVTDFFQANRTAYLVMHYIEGITMRQHLTQSGERLPLETTMKIMLPVMDALQVVHEAGLLHRDVSPENIIISHTGRILLIDFGAARRSAGGRDDSVSVIMKPGYTPEEQYRSRGVQGPWTDVYAVAATIYRSLTGKLPPNSLDRLEHDTLVPPSDLGVKILSAVEAALLRGLAVSGKARYQSMAEFRSALLQQVHEQQVPPKTLFKEAPPIIEKRTEKKPDSERLPEGKGISRRDLPVAPPGQPSRRPPRSYTTLGDINLGRAPDNDLILQDETASRYHARIFSRDGRWYITDLDSTHGTYLNDRRIQDPLELIDPALIRLSDTILRFEGGKLLDQGGNLLRTLNDHISFTERWFTNEKLSPNRFIEDFIASLDKLAAGLQPGRPEAMISIGRAADNDLVIPDEMVSRYHARIFYYQDKWYLADLQSTHGTRVNDLPVIDPVQIEPYDRIELSEINLTLNGGSLYTEDGEHLYTLPQPQSFSERMIPAISSHLPNPFQDKLISARFWFIVIAATGILAIILLLILLIS